MKIFETIELINHMSEAKLHFTIEAYLNNYTAMTQYANLAF